MADLQHEMVARFDRVERLILEGYRNTMTSIADIANKVQSLATAEARETALLGSVQTELASVKADLKVALANADDPAALQAIADKLDAITTDIGTVAPEAPAAAVVPPATATSADPSTGTTATPTPDASVTDAANTGAPNTPNATT